MNKKISTILFLVAIASFAYYLLAAPAVLSKNGNDDGNGNSGSSGKSIDKEIKPQSENEEVIKLQDKLIEQGFLETPITGFFGFATENAVKEFQKDRGLPETGITDEATREALNGLPLVMDSSAASGQSEKTVDDLAAMIERLQIQVQKIQDELEKQNLTVKSNNVQTEIVSAAAQAAAGIIITGAVSGPGYPTGPLNITLPATQLLFDHFGQVKGGEVKDRQYEAPLETIPPTMGAFSVTINGVANTATQLKVISSLKTKNGIGQHQGTIDVDIDTVPTGHVTLQYNGTATVVGSAATGSSIVSKGTFKTAKTTGMFAGLVAEGTYEMTIVEGGTIPGSPVTVTLTTVSP